MADFTSDFYRHPQLKQPVRFVIGGDFNPLTIGVKDMRVQYQMEIWNSDMTAKINHKASEQLRKYTDNEERRTIWVNTLLMNLVNSGYSTIGEAITGSIFQAILDKQGLTDEDKIVI